jgi:serine/threonine-protein kinase
MVHSGARSPLDVGSVIAGTYTIERLIGKGGMGAVFLASHARLPGKKVAIKVLHADIADPESMARFRREAEIATRLGHANIVEVHDFNVLEDGTPYLVLEFLQGESLDRRIASGALTVEQTMTIVRQVGAALVAAHREEIIHRDLKPQNVFLVPVEADGYTSERAKVLDFGISKIRGSQTIKTQDTSILGTPQYMAPEQALGNHAAVDARTDVFALGAMVYEMLCGAPAFAGASVPEVVFKVVYEEPQPLAARVPGLPPHVTAAVHRALAKKADERFPDVASFVEALTGQPLTTGKRPLVVPAPPAAAESPEKISNREAFAQTVGSGDHAQSLGIQATVASGRHETPAPVAPADTAPPAAPAKKGKTAVIVAVVGLVAAAGIAAAVVMSGGGGTDADHPERGGGAAESKDAAPVAVAAPDAAPVAVAAADAAPVAAAPPDAAPKKKDPVVKKDPEPEPEPDPDPDDEGPTEARATLRECTKLLGEDPDEAMRCANKILEKYPNTRAAHAIRAKAYCANEDQEKAMSAARRLGKGRLRKQVNAFCAKHGIQLN